MRPFYSTPLFTLLAACALMTSACGASRNSALDKENVAGIGKAVKKGSMADMLAQADGAWLKRMDKAELMQAIAFYETATTTESPDLSEQQRRDKLIETYARLARAYYFLADSHLRLESKEEDDMNDQMMATFEKGVTAAERGIAVADPAFAKKIADDPSSWQDHIGSASTDAYPALYWYATNLGKWALLEGITTILARKDDIKATMDLIVTKTPTYFYGAPHRYFAVYHTKVPIGGGDPPKSKKSFENSLEIAPNYLATRVLYAEAYGVLTQDQALFKRQLQTVLDTPADVVPELTPENTLEQRKAKRLLKQQEDFFY